MKRIILYLLAFAPLAAFAQLNGSGYYRVQNDYTKRYISVVDTRASIEASATGAGNVNADLDALYMLKGFEEKVAFNPASICFVETIGENSVNISGQGLDLYDRTGYLLYYSPIGDGYRIYGSYKGMAAKYLADDDLYADYGYEKEFHPNLNGVAQTMKWYVWPVDQSEHYFGVKPEITATADNSYWSTMYAGFPFKVSASTTKMYRVSTVDNKLGVAVISEITGNVPAQTPVLFRCTGATPSDNKLTLLDPNTSATIGDNYLNGNYYCNDVVANSDAKKNHRNVKVYNENTMRILGVDSEGKPAFVKGNSSNLVVSTVESGKLLIPANKCFLAVSSTAPDVLKIMTEAEYETYVTGIEQITTSTTDGAKVIYDLQGRRVQAPSKGLYIVNGKKMIIR